MVKGKLVGKLKMLNKSYARGVMKLWALHHVALMQVRWDLMVYEIPLSFVEGLEKAYQVVARGKQEFVICSIVLKEVSNKASFY